MMGSHRRMMLKSQITKWVIIDIMYCTFGIELYVLFSTQVEVFVCKMGRVDRLETPTPQGCNPQYREWTVGSLSRAKCCLIITQFTGCHQPVQRSYWTENAIDWLA